MRFALAPPTFGFVLLLGLVAAPLAAAQTDSTAAAPAPVPAVEPVPEVETASVPAPVAVVPTEPRKDPTLGHLLGYLIPGGGHFYAGEASTGVAVIATGAVGYGLILTSLSSCSLDCSDVNATPALAGIGLVIGAAIYSVVDGGRAVRRANRRNGYATATPRATLAPGGEGLALRVRL